MIQSHRTAPALSLQPMMVQRRRPLIVAPPLGQAPAFALDGGDATERSWVDDLRFFLAAYAAGLLFFLVMLS